MDPDEDIIDVLYKRDESPPPAILHKQMSQRGATLQRQASSSNNSIGFHYHHPPNRNYYEDLYQLQRRNFHGSDSVFSGSNVEKRPLSRTDSINVQQVGRAVSI
jgi:hypothetical protein